MKNIYLNIIILFFLNLINLNTQAQSIKDNFIIAKQQLENMLNGKDSLTYEKAIYIIENAYNNNKTTYEDFQKIISFYIEMIEQVVKNQDIQPKYQPTDFYQKARQLSDEYNHDFTNASNNFGIFTFMTDTTFFRLDSNLVMYNLPYRYSTTDPMGTDNWHNTQVINLLQNGNGNCFALSSLFKIFADRLLSNATLCTAPNHIYIRHLDERGTRYNIDLSTHTFPGTGTLKTLTYTTKEAIQNNISLRKLTTQQAIVLCMVYLAKGYQYKLNMKDDFMMECAETALKYDSLSLNAMLLKAEYLEHILQQENKTVIQLQNDINFKEYEELLSKIYTLGYREMPLDMKNVLVHGWKKDTTMLYLQNHELVKNDETRKWTLSNGLFDEEHTYKPIEQYGQTLFNCKTNKIQGFVKEKPLYNDYYFDPVAFAWNVDPLAYKYAGQSPYIFGNNTPIAGIDRDGLEFYFTADGVLLGKYGKSNEIRVVKSYYLKQAQQTINSNGNGKDNSRFSAINMFSVSVTNASLQEASRVYQTIYNKEIGGKASVTATNNEPTSWASTDANGNIKVSINNIVPWADGTKSNLMSDYYDVSATLDHEDYHRNGISDDGFSHFEIGLKQLKFKYYNETSKYSKENLIDNMKSYLYEQENDVLRFKGKDENSYLYYSKKIL